MKRIPAPVANMMVHVRCQITMQRLVSSLVLIAYLVPRLPFPLDCAHATTVDGTYWDDTLALGDWIPSYNLLAFIAP